MAVSLTSEEVVAAVLAQSPKGRGAGERGDLGFNIRPSARGTGLALVQVLLRIESFGLEKVLLVPAEGNHVSARTVEGNGGVLEDARGTGSGAKRRYWRTVTR